MRLSSVTHSLLFLSPSPPGEARRYVVTSRVSLGCREKVAEEEESIPRVGLEWRRQGWERGISTQARGICAGKGEYAPGKGGIAPEKGGFAPRKGGICAWKRGISMQKKGYLPLEQRDLHPEKGD